MAISKNRKLEIKNQKTSATYRQRIKGFNYQKELELFLAEEPKFEYSRFLTSFEMTPYSGRLGEKRRFL